MVTKLHCSKICQQKILALFNFSIRIYHQVPLLNRSPWCPRFDSLSRQTLRVVLQPYDQQGCRVSLFLKNSLEQKPKGIAEFFSSKHPHLAYNINRKLFGNENTLLYIYVQWQPHTNQTLCLLGFHCYTFLSRQCQIVESIQCQGRKFPIQPMVQFQILTNPAQLFLS